MKNKLGRKARGYVFELQLLQLGLLITIFIAHNIFFRNYHFCLFSIEKLSHKRRFRMISSARFLTSASRITARYASTTIGFVGLGNMGASMAENLIKTAGKDETIVLHDVVPANITRILEKYSSQSSKACTIRAAKDIQDLASSCGVVITMVPNTQHVETLMTGGSTSPVPQSGVFAHAKKNTLVIDCSTIDPLVSRALSTKALSLPSSLTMIDAPVSGGVTGAAAGTLTFMCGGTAEALESAKPILSRMGKKIIHCGPSGTGGVTKLCNNLALAISMAGTAEAMHLGASMGMDPKILAEVMNSSTARCWSSDSYNPVPGVMEGVPASRGYDGGFGSSLMLKDLSLALGCGQKSGLGETMPMGKRVMILYEEVCRVGYAAKDFGVVFKYLQEGKGK